MICTVPIGQNAAVSCCWFQCVFFLAKWAVNTHASSSWNFCWLSFLEFEECLNRNFIHWNISISSYTKKFQSKIHQSFECNLIPATSYRSKKRVHLSNNQFMNVSWPGLTVISPSETFELFWAFFAFTTLFSLFDMVLHPQFFFSLLSLQNKVNELLPVNSLLLFVAVKWRYGSSS